MLLIGIGEELERKGALLGLHRRRGMWWRGDGVWVSRVLEGFEEKEEERRRGAKRVQFRANGFLRLC